MPEIIAYEKFEIRYNDPDDNPISDLQLRDIDNILFFVQTVLGLEIQSAWIFETIHGHIIDIHVNSRPTCFRMSQRQSDWLNQLNFRWVESGSDRINFGLKKYFVKG